MARKSDNKRKTAKCGRCGEAHEGYSGKLDKNGVEYVVCNIPTLIEREKEMVDEMHRAGMRIRDSLGDLRRIYYRGVEQSGSSSGP